MPAILLLHASDHGHTTTIARRIAESLERDGVTVDLRSSHDGDDPAPGGYDAVIVGASIHAGKHQKGIIDWVHRHRATLAMRPNAFFSVCLTAADDTEESRTATRRYLDEFVEATDWTPDLAV